MTALPPRQPTIARIWRGRTLPARADAYEAYNYEAGIEPLLGKALGVQTFREDREHETEFVTISYWESVEDDERVHRRRSDARASSRARPGVPDRAARTACRCCGCGAATAWSSPAIRPLPQGTPRDSRDRCRAVASPLVERRKSAGVALAGTA